MRCVWKYAEDLGESQAGMSNGFLMTVADLASSRRGGHARARPRPGVAPGAGRAAGRGPQPGA
jgi:hypothetical protein